VVGWAMVWRPASLDSSALPPSIAWRNALGMTLVGCIVLGPCFVVLPPLLGRRCADLFRAGVWLEIAFTAALATIFFGIRWWQRAHGAALAELGWRRPTSAPALLAGSLVGLGWLGLSYLGFRQILPGVDVTALDLARVL